MAALTVKAPLIVVKTEDGTQHYLRRGATLPDWVDKDHVKQLRDSDLVEAAKSKPAARSSKAAKTDGSESDQPFDPSKYNQDDVLAYLADADADEVGRVKAAEAEGRKRDKIAAFEPAGNDPATQ